MPNNPLFYPIYEQLRTAPVIEQIQMALAIANPVMLKALLANCMPQIAQPFLIDEIAAEICVPTEAELADAIIHFNAIKHTLLTPQWENGKPQAPCEADNNQVYARLTQYESELLTLGHHLTPTEAIALLTSAGFSSQQVDAILQLSSAAWHKSWWCSLDANEQFTIPFLRLMRVLRYPDGTCTLQFKDYFEQSKPSCFKSSPQQAVVKIRGEKEGFGETLAQINRMRRVLGDLPIILICNTLSELEAQAFIHQGVCIYPAVELVLPTVSNCSICGRRECFMNGLEDSPVAMCYGFLA